MNKIQKIFYNFYHLNDYIGCTFFVGLFFLVNLQVFFRYVLNEPLIWPEEIARFLFIWVTYLGLVKNIRENEHYRIDFILNRLSAKVKNILYIVFDLVMLVFFLIILFGSYELISSNSHVKTSIGWPVNVIYSSLPVMALLSMPLLCLSLIKRIRD